MSVFLTVILERFNAVSKSLQKETIELQTAVNMLKSLSDFLTSQRDLFDEYKEKANEKVKTQYFDNCNRLRKRKRHHADGDAEEVVLLGKGKFRIEIYLPTLDRLSAKLNRCMQVYDKIHSLFGFLVEFPSETNDKLRHATETFERIILMTSISNSRKKWLTSSISHSSLKVMMIKHLHRNHMNSFVTT